MIPDLEEKEEYDSPEVWRGHSEESGNEDGTKDKRTFKSLVHAATHKAGDVSSPAAHAHAIAMKKRATLSKQQRHTHSHTTPEKSVNGK